MGFSRSIAQRGMTEIGVRKYASISDTSLGMTRKTISRSNSGM